MTTPKKPMIKTGDLQPPEGETAPTERKPKTVKTAEALRDTLKPTKPKNGGVW